ncbi:MAG: hypothetical protein JKX78_03680 [Alteromonadaceae bacterium]|nr:hypothetical protein [Alteromonadaceae bacterium]MBL4909119.1 hypothetical protein [Alteromonadaceae bacterium]
MEYTQNSLTKLAAISNFFTGKCNGEERVLLEGMLSEANRGTSAFCNINDLLTNDFDSDNSGYMVNMCDGYQCVWSAREINGMYTVFMRYMEALETAARTAPTANMKAAGDAIDLTNEQVQSTANAMLVTRCLTIINTPDAMAAILKEATELFATHNNTTPEIVIQAYSAGHPVAKKDMDRLIQQSVVELAKASFTWTVAQCKGAS